MESIETSSLDRGGGESIECIKDIKTLVSLVRALRVLFCAWNTNTHRALLASIDNNMESLLIHRLIILIVRMCYYYFACAFGLATGILIIRLLKFCDEHVRGAR